MNKKELMDALDELGVPYKKSDKKDELAALLREAQRTNRTFDASRQKGV